MHKASQRKTYENDKKGAGEGERGNHTKWLGHRERVFLN